MRTMILLVIVSALVASGGLAGLHVYSRQQLTSLRGRPAYATAEDGMRAMVRDWYVRLQSIEIVHAGYEPCFLDNVYFVEARVWADGRVDGKMISADGDNPGGFFLRTGDGWVFVPERKRPWFVALGARLFGHG